jgi:hypothetical protein
MKTNRFKLVVVVALVAIMGFTFTGGKAYAQQYAPESDFQARPIDGGKGVAITGYLGDKWEVNIPSKIRGLPVTYIGYGAFAGKGLINVTIPNSVTLIDPYAFAGNELTSITIPNSVTHILRWAFDNNELTSVTIGANVLLDDEIIRNWHEDPSGFTDFYNSNGKAAGTYTRPDADSETWTKK